ncbi:MAG: hypothetical protein HOO86_01820 [Bacteroidales bacterium]|nr:hypothetical protein [Bacteroidales bacterium]
MMYISSDFVKWMYAANSMNDISKIALSAVIGGTAETLGGKFANGAVTGAFVMMLNHMAQQVDGGDDERKKNAPWMKYAEEELKIGVSETVDPTTNNERIIEYLNQQEKVEQH